MADILEDAHSQIRKSSGVPFHTNRLLSRRRKHKPTYTWTLAFTPETPTWWLRTFKRQSNLQKCILSVKAWFIFFLFQVDFPTFLSLSLSLELWTCISAVKVLDFLLSISYAWDTSGNFINISFACSWKKRTHFRILDSSRLNTVQVFLGVIKSSFQSFLVLRLSTSKIKINLQGWVHANNSKRKKNVFQLELSISSFNVQCWG